MSNNNSRFRYLFLLTLLITVAFNTQIVYAQADSLATTHKIAAGPEYKRSAFYRFFLGSNYRKEWTTPVNLPVLYIDKVKGGLKPVGAGGSNQTKSIELETADKRVYTLRSVNKSLGKIIPRAFHGTFVEDIVTDEVSTSHPYGALGVPLLAEKAGLYHTNPTYYYLPKQPALDTFNERFGDQMYLLEEKPKGNWSTENDLGNFTEFEDLEDIHKTLFKDHDNQVDQQLFARQRLLDMLIGDWDRHGDQYKWGNAGKAGEGFYQSVPTDRDQAFFKYDGLLLHYIILTTGFKLLKSYDDEIRNIETYASINRSLDRLMTNKLALEDWQKTAAALKESLTDKVIDSAIRQVPPEIFSIRGEQTISYLKSRRDKLVEYATDYYLFLAKNIEVVGSKKKEYFEVTNLGSGETAVNVFKLDKKGDKDQVPYYSRKFTAKETREIHLYGLSGHDVYEINGDGRSAIKLRIIGGDEKDSIIDHSTGPGMKIHIYDGKDNVISKRGNTRLHLSADSSVNTYNYNHFLGRKNFIKPLLGYNDEDRLFVGVGFVSQTHKFRKEPFASKQELNLQYSIFQNGVSVNYNALMPKLLGNWDFLVKGYYDQVRWINFFGLGNETVLTTKDIDFHRMRSREGFGSLMLARKLGRRNNIKLSGFFQSVDIINDSARFIAKTSLPAVYEANNLIGARLDYGFTMLDDSIVPTRGIAFNTNISHNYNMVKGTNFQKYAGYLKIYIPVVSRAVSFAIGAGAATVEGKPEFFQYPSIGESYNLRGYRRERFYGKTSFYNTNELRLMTKFKSYLFNGGLGIMGFVDNGRVWMPGEHSDTWHTSYGGGLIIIPFKLVMAQLTYGISKEDKLIQLKVKKDF